MKIINRIVKELWRATYRGNDIDYIEIKTDETDGVSAGADKRKVYNYKVCIGSHMRTWNCKGTCPRWGRAEQNRTRWLRACVNFADKG